MQETTPTPNPYESPLIVTEESSSTVDGRGRMIHIFIVAAGALLGGIVMFGVPYVVWFSGNRTGTISTAAAAIFGIPVGAVVGGLFAKWSALYFLPLPGRQGQGPI